MTSTSSADRQLLRAPQAGAAGAGAAGAGAGGVPAYLGDTAALGAHL